MVAGFLKDNCMEPATGSGDNVGGISARRAGFHTDTDTDTDTDNDAHVWDGRRTGTMR